MDKPFLEISILETTETKLSHVELLQKLQADFLSSYQIPKSHVRITDKPSLSIKFDSKAAFIDMYNQDLHIYEYLYKKILSNDLLFQLEKVKKKRAKNPNPEINYIVLKYASNFLEPMRKSYQLVYKINVMLGSLIYNEEVHDGFVRFVRTREDFEGMLSSSEDVQGWITWLQALGIDIEDPTIEKFIEILRESFSY